MQKATGSYLNYPILANCNLILEFVVADLPLDRTAALVPELAVKDLPLGRTL